VRLLGLSVSTYSDIDKLSVWSSNASFGEEMMGGRVSHKLCSERYRAIVETISGSLLYLAGLRDVCITAFEVLEHKHVFGNTLL
jgi:hypothetical protein